MKRLFIVAALLISIGTAVAQEEVRLLLTGLALPPDQVWSGGMSSSWSREFNTMEMEAPEP